MDYCKLPDTGALAARGPDAVTFLQGQLTQDVRRVADRGALRAAYNTPQGRVIALARLHPLDDGVLLQLPRALVPVVAARLQRFVLRSKVKLLDVSDEWGYAGLVAPTSADLESLGIDAAEPGAPRALGDGVTAVRLDERWLLQGPAPALAHRLAGARARGPDDWHRAAILAGDPTVEPSASEAWIAQMLNLDLLDGISFTKG
ncbi:MAG: YgfZ/GcvT domain-containing protein, partial [Pseudomonadota bacterium]